VPGATHLFVSEALSRYGFPAGHPLSVDRQGAFWRAAKARGIAERATLPDCIMTFAYWNPRFLDQPRLLNAQNGEYLDVTVHDLGTDTVAVRGAPTPRQL